MTRRRPHDTADARRRERQPQRMTVDGMRRVAVTHLQRFPCSKRHLLRVLDRKIKRSARHYGDDPAPLLTAAAAAIDSLDGGALLDDRRYATALAGSLHRRGKSLRGIRQKLREKGVDGETAAEALATLTRDADRVDPDLRAATRYARRRRLGPFQRTAERRALRREKDLAALGRQGFGYGIARQVIDALDADELPDD